MMMKCQPGKKIMHKQGKLLVIGSAVADVIITLDHLPGRSEDVHVHSQEMRLSGCAYNTFDTVRHFGVPAIPFFPVGGGAYGDFVRKCFAERGIETPVPSPDEDNGCCYCFIEADGERTFISYHGAEYRFRPEWFSIPDTSEIDAVYICGLEIEEPTGVHIVAFLEKLFHEKENSQSPLRIYYAPGPRLNRIDPALSRRIFRLHPVLHLNEQEACECRFISDSLHNKPGDLLCESCRALYQLTGAPVIVTLGCDGCCYFDGRTFDHIPPVQTTQIDTIGAGDSHIGAVMACIQLGRTLPEALTAANRISSRVVSVRGALLSDEEFDAAIHEEDRSGNVRRESQI